MAGYGQRGRVRLGAQLAGTSAFTPPALPTPRADAITLSGAWPFSTQFTSGVTMSNWSVAGPPEQWFMPGTRNRRAKFAALPPLAAATESYQLVVSSLEKIGSLVPW